MTDARQRIDFEGRSVAWDVNGEGSPLVLVHGTPFSSHVWHRVLPWLVRRHRVYTFDLLGYGRSEKGGDVSLGVQSRLLRTLFEYWALDRPAVVAHDFGGATVLRGWILEGLRYRALTLIDPVVLSPWGSPFVAHVRKHEEAFAGLPTFAHRALLASYIEGRPAAASATMRSSRIYAHGWTRSAKPRFTRRSPKWMPDTPRKSSIASVRSNAGRQFFGARTTHGCHSNRESA